MSIKQQFKMAVIAMPLVMVGLQAGAQSKLGPDVATPQSAEKFDEDRNLSRPMVDGDGLTLEVSVPSIYVPIIPCRLADTRQTETPFGQQEVMGFWGWAGSDCADSGTCYGPFGGSTEACGIPSTATAIHVNFTIVAPKGNGFLRVWPNNADEPGATFMAWVAGASASNAGTVAICADSTESSTFTFPGEPGPNADCPNSHSTHDFIIDYWVKIYGQAQENLVIDAFGYYAPAP